MLEVGLVKGYVGKLPDGFLLSLNEIDEALIKHYEGKVRILAWIHEASNQEAYTECLGILNEMPQDQDRFLTTLLFHLKREDFVFYPELLYQAIEAYDKGAGTKESWTAEVVVERISEEQACCKLPNGETVWAWVGYGKRPRKGDIIEVKAIRRVDWYGEESLNVV